MLREKILSFFIEGVPYMMSTYDSLVIGAGFAGAVAARELAERGNQKVLLLERRPHIGGNAYDCLDPSGILIHQYGPHIFHTNSKRVYDYLSRFTQWRGYQHRVVADVYGLRMPVPFNLDSLRLAFGPDKGAHLEEKLLSAYGPEQKIGILELRQNPDPDLALVADYIYENVFLQYTMKQWGTTPEEIDPNTTARVPVFLSRDDRYFQDTYQGMPQEGYASMFQQMLDHPNITLCLGVSAEERLTLGETSLLLDDSPFHGPVIYSGAVDELFSCRLGRLPYRTLDFNFETLPCEWFQSHGTVNYTVEEPFTRITEFKHLTGQQSPQTTTIVREFSRAYEGEPGEIPYYAIISPKNRTLYESYRTLSSAYPNLYLLGRLAEYQYYNMDAITERALSLCDTLLTTV